MPSPGVQPAIAESVQQTASIPVTSRHRWIDLGLVLLVGFAPLVASSFYALFLPIVGNARSTNLRFATGLVQMAGVLTLCFTLLKRQGRSLKDIGFGFNWLDVPKGIGLYILSYVMFAVSSGTIQFLYFKWMGSYLELRDPKVIFAGASTMLVIVYGLVAPFFEETLVRGYLMTELIALSRPVWLAATISVVLQGSYHLYYGFPGALTVSAGFAVLAIYFAISRRLWPVILAHFFWDLTATYLNWHR
jgi:membrane protease YdiL (CAAX protease family)